MICADPRLTRLQRVANTLMDSVWDAHDWVSGALLERGSNLPRAERADADCEDCHGAGEYPVEEVAGDWMFYEGEECHCAASRNPYYRAAGKLTRAVGRLHARVYTLPPDTDEECPF